MTQARKRQSRSCGAFLAADHRQVICGACARRRIERAVNAPSLPDEFWTSPQLRKAFTARDFGKVIRAYLDARKGEVSQGDLARWLDVTQSLVSLVATGKRSVRDLHKLERWAIALRVPPAYLWFKLPPVDDSAEGDNVQRRQLLRSASILGVSAPVDFGYSTPSPVKAITRPDVAIIRETTQTFRKLDNQFGGGHSLSTVSTYLSSQVEPLLKRASGTGRERRELFSAAVELHQLAGWMAYDTGNADSGRKHLRNALKLSQEIDDDAQPAEMLAGMSHHASFYKEADVAVDLAIAARQEAKRSGLAALQSEAAIMEAHGLAIRGDSKGSLDAMRHAEQAFSAILRGLTPSWLAYFDEAYLAAKFAHSFLALRQPVDAERFARLSLQMSDGYERGKLFNTALLASTLADQRKVDEACTVATEAIRMAENVRSVRTLAYLTDVSNRLIPFRSNVGVRELERQMIELGVPVRGK